MNRRWWLAATPALLGAVAAAVVLVAVPQGELRVSARLPVPIALGGLVLTGALTIPLVLRRTASNAAKHARDAAQREAHEDRRRFLLRLDHELKNPLTAIQASLANLDTMVGSDGRDALDSGRAQTARLVRLVADLRKLAELESRPLERDRVDLPEVLTEVEAAAKELPQADGRLLSLTLPKAPWPLPHITGDRDLIFLAVHNLVANAVKFSKPGDRIEIRGFEEREHVVVEVADTGAGIPDDEIPDMWEELARGKAARGVPGTGLGLAFVRTVVARHGGSVALRSREHEGTVVALRFHA